MTIGRPNVRTGGGGRRPPRLRERGFGLLEVQYVTAHLAQFGAVEISTRAYERQLAVALAMPCGF
mgnify:CR=1 FL=1